MSFLCELFVIVCVCASSEWKDCEYFSSKLPVNQSATQPAIYYFDLQKL